MSSARRYGSVLVALVLWRSAVWVLWEQSDFDSDQAVIGLMATHLAEGRAFPVFMYGQTYLLGVEAWLAAPLVAIFGPSVGLLKLPIVLMNVAIVLMLFGVMRRDAGLSPRHAFLTCLFFAAAPPFTASRLTAAAGGSVEPFLYGLCLWMLRARPWTFGIVAGIGTTHREFTWYAIAAIGMIEVWEGTLFTTARWLAWARSAIAAVATAAALRILGTYHGDVLGPGTAGMPPGDLIVSPASQLCADLAAVPGNLEWLFTRNLSMLFGWWPETMRAYGATRGVEVGHPWLVIPLGGLVLLSGGVIFRDIVQSWHPRASRISRGTAATRMRGLPAFLILVGVQAALAYALIGCGIRDVTLVRYTLLALFVPVGLTAWALAAARTRALQLMLTIMILTWASVSFWDSARVLEEYWHRTPPNRVRQLITYLDMQGIRFGRGPYWTAYVVDFMSNERIIVDSTEQVRVQEYRNRVDEADTTPGQAVVDISPEPCTLPGFTHIQGWCVRRRP